MTHATVSEWTGNAIAVHAIHTPLKPFSGSAFNWARKNDAGDCSVIVKLGTRFYAMRIARLPDGNYEGKC